MINQIIDKNQKEQICKSILSNLPEWFGIESAITSYAKESKDMLFWTATLDDEIAGFITLKETSPHTMELYVMGVLKEFHGKGIGKKLFQSCYGFLVENKYSFLQVKTVKEGYYKEYDATIAFYKRVGFKEFECIPTIWDEDNPCQIFAMSIK